MSIQTILKQLEYLYKTNAYHIKRGFRIIDSNPLIASWTTDEYQVQTKTPGFTRNNRT